MADKNNLLRTEKKPSYPIRSGLRHYLQKTAREFDLPVTYDQLKQYHEGIPLCDARGNDTLWETVIYPAGEMDRLAHGLTMIYALLKAEGDLSIMDHLYVDRIDYCTFGNSNPFRIRIVNSYNDNQDYYYVKKADASRIYGLELEHLLSPNRMHFLTCANTLIEEHIVGIPGDVFIEDWLFGKNLNPVRLAKELVKFNERCFVRLLGDMRAYNFVVAVTFDHEDVQIRIRAMDFDQQSYHGRMNFYRPQFFKDNFPLVNFCLSHLNRATSYQYQREEQALVRRRMQLAAPKVKALLKCMENDRIAPDQKVLQLRAELADHHKSSTFLKCQSMGGIVRQSLENLKLSANISQISS